MSVIVQENKVLQDMEVTQINPRGVRGPAIDSKPVAGGQVTIKLALTPGMITLIASPITVLATMLLGYIFTMSIGLPLCPREMVGGAIVNAVGGILAALPLFFMMKRGAQAIAQGAIFGIAIRIGSILLGLMAAQGPGWHLMTMPLVYWVLAYYFPLLIVETSIVGWLSFKAKH